MIELEFCYLGIVRFLHPIEYQLFDMLLTFQSYNFELCIDVIGLIYNDLNVMCLNCDLSLF